MSETKINVSQTTITAEDIGAAPVYDTMPTAAVGYLDKIVQYVGATDANYTNGYFYKCVSDGQDPATYSWTAVQVQASSGGLPSQSGNSGKFLTTDGTDASWSDKPLVNATTLSGSVSIKGNAATSAYCVNVGVATTAGGGSGYATAVGYYARATSTSAVAIGESSNATGGSYTTAIGASAQATQTRAIQLGAGTNDSATLKVGFGNLGNYELLNSSGTIPSDRLPNAINKYSTMPTAASTNVGWIVQFTGTTDSTYTHGYIYECKAQGTDPETYAWEAVEVQAGGGGGGLPSQTGNSGKFLTTDGTDASWSDKPIVNTANLPAQQVGILGTVATSSDAYGIAIGSGATQLGRNRSIAIGYNSIAGKANGITSNVAIGNAAEATGGNSGFAIALGSLAKATETGAIQIGDGTNSTPGTFNVGLRNLGGTNNYQLLASDGTIPAARHAALPAADGTYTLQVVITNGVPTLSWVAV